jgi:serine/threonine protein phosphatase 1
LILALADLHGRADLLEGVLTKTPADTQFVFLGDAIDRGRRNRDTIKLLTKLADEGRMVLLKGNHEAMYEDVDATYDRFQLELKEDMKKIRRLDALEALQNWVMNGGDTVILEYGGWDSGGLEDAFGPWGLPPELLAYAARCKFEHAVNGILCAHAAPPVQLKGTRGIEETMVWARPEDGPFPLPEGYRLSLHGHTPLQAPTRLGQNIFVDLGAVWTGMLCGYDLETDQITVFKGKGLVPLTNLPELPVIGGVTPVKLEYNVVEL